MFDCVGVYDDMLVTVTACGECCTGCPKKEKGICREFPCEMLTSVIHWNPDIVDHLKKLALHYFAEQKVDHKAI